MAYASGKDAWGISDRSGFRYRLRDMKKEWTGALVGPDEFEPKHPQLYPPRVGLDPQALRNPRPDEVEPLIVFVGIPLVPMPDPVPIRGITFIGQAFALPSIEVVPSSATGTGLVGDLSISGDGNLSILGVEGTSALGTATVSISVVAEVSRVSAFGEISPVLFTGDALVTPTNDPEGWGEGAWNVNTWGNPPAIPAILGVTAVGSVTVVTS